MARSRFGRLPKRLPQTFQQLIEAGGPAAFAKAAAAAAARQEFEFWLQILEGVRDDLEEHDQMFCDLYLRDLRRKLGLRPPKQEIREQTRLRVRRFRERRALVCGT